MAESAAEGAVSRGERRPIRILPPEEARKIAAGEVIDRPAALVREFLDNAIDAGSTQVELRIEGGGSRCAEVSDDGQGMPKDDLLLCWKTHATSKISSMDDLGCSKTLGFRGEALAAAAAVSRLEILTSTDGREAWKLGAGPGGERAEIEASRRSKGTTVRASGLFDAIPARKRFLKREGSEALLCRQAFIDKALAFPDITFRFIQDGKMKIFLPPAANKKERFAAALMESREAPFLHEIHASGQGFTLTVVCGGPELYRRDRRQQYLFANGRRIQDFSLLQALEYGVQGCFPNGTHPVGAVYVEIDPALADFNIHPAKREVRFKDGGAIHHAVTSSLRDFMHHRGISLSAERNESGAELPRHADSRESLFEDGQLPARSTGEYPRPYRREGPLPKPYVSEEGRRTGAAAMEALLDERPDFAPKPGRALAEAAGAEISSEGSPAYGGYPEQSRIRLAGRAFGLFILAEKDDRLFIIDQHAAHERILYDRFLSKDVPMQELLVPIPFSTADEEEDFFLESCREELRRMGILIERDEDSWLLSALPVNWKKGDAETVKEILSLREAGENMAERWAAALSCHSAVKDGDYLDDSAAAALAEEALALPLPRCPHGRPVWTEITREELFRAVRRIE